MILKTPNTTWACLFNSLYCCPYLFSRIQLHLVHVHFYVNPHPLVKNRPSKKVIQSVLPHSETWKSYYDLSLLQILHVLNRCFGYLWYYYTGAECIQSLPQQICPFVCTSGRLNLSLWTSLWMKLDNIDKMWLCLYHSGCSKALL